MSGDDGKKIGEKERNQRIASNVCHLKVRGHLTNKASILRKKIVSQCAIDKCNFSHYTPMLPPSDESGRNRDQICDSFEVAFDLTGLILSQKYTTLIRFIFYFSIDVVLQRLNN